MKKKIGKEKKKKIKRIKRKWKHRSCPTSLGRYKAEVNPEFHCCVFVHQIILNKMYTLSHTGTKRNILKRNQGKWQLTIARESWEN